MNEVSQNNLEWDSDEQFPISNFEVLTLLNGRHQRTDSREIDRCLRTWTPYSTDLVGGIGERLLLPICVDSMQVLARQSYLRRYAIAVSIWLLAALFSAFFARSASATKVGLAALILAGYFVLDYCVLAGRKGLEDRARLIYWLKHSQRVRNIALVAVLAVALFGISQFTLFQLFGTTSEVIRRFGLLFEAANEGELWRLLTGPYLHADLFHYLGNASFFVPAMVIATLMAGRHAPISFFAGNLVTACFAWWHASGEHQAFAGISGGVMTLLGLAAVGAYASKRHWPRWLFLNVAALGVLALALTCMLNSAALISTHLVGLLFGIGYGLILFVLRGNDSDHL